MRSIVQFFAAAFCVLASAAGTGWAVDPALPYGINVHLPSSALDRVAAAGIAWIRVDFNWFMMEPARGVCDWTTSDAVVSDARARGLNIYATLAYSPAWATGRTSTALELAHGPRPYEVDRDGGQGAVADRDRLEHGQGVGGGAGGIL